MTSAELDDLPHVLTSVEGARVLRMGVREFRALIDRGELPAVRLGPRRVIRVKKSAVLALLDGSVTTCKSVRRWKGRIVP